MSSQDKTQMDLSFVPEYEVLGSAPTMLTFNVTLSAPEVEEAAKRSTVSLTAVIDKSGSMAGEKMRLVKQSCNFLLNQLSSTDKMGLVEYDTTVNTVIELARTSDSFKAEAASVIASMQPGSLTNLSGGLFAGVKQQQDNRFVDWDKAMPPAVDDVSTSDASPSSAAAPPIQRPRTRSSSAKATPTPGMLQQARAKVQKTDSDGGKAGNGHAAESSSARFACRTPTSVQRGRTRVFEGLTAGPSEVLEEDALRCVFLFTDGLANVGIINTEELVQTLGQALDKPTIGAGAGAGVRVQTFGFGSDHSEALLGELARHGAGSYYFVEKEEAVPAAFGDALGGLLSVAAQNATMLFKPAPGMEMRAVHTPYKTRTEPDGSWSITIGDMLSEDKKDFLFDVQLPAWEEGVEEEVLVGTLVVSYLDVQGACLRNAEIQCKVKRTKTMSAVAAVANEGVALQKARVETVEVLGAARLAAEAGRIQDARRMLQEALEKVGGGEWDGGSGGSGQLHPLQQRLLDDLKEAMANMHDSVTFMRKGKQLMMAKSMCHGLQKSAYLSDDEEEAEEEAEEEDQQDESRNVCSRGKHSYSNKCQKGMRKRARKECKGC
mmetsp:Transcript_55405/g.113280  ORF Transcript_55405/g.113280 Transcript_55405/m.113280 type:complete len:604 (+) Transcript_55405:169-1980(+)|eukprot:CAMPEP_0181315584 /NCGR_PEP_ID=MMETSP1101-20121128/15455_1 /TAXON_ID=46948 /ORGANISM="Rhodomonas abbreviata, Strain Caron Lab Isolate" /LENGTH=603 /DNA_ID=CAMNT_0023422805 /DNA_START=168 /DNA_END=1979 /DNA_ORIENTATION=-